MSIMTPDLCALNNKIENIRSYRALGQQRNFLLGGHSGMGKTTHLDWYTSIYMPIVERERNHVPIIKIDAPVSNHSPKPLFQRLVLGCGKTYAAGDNEEDLLMDISLYFQQCGVEVVILDEIEHITRPEIRRRVLEISNSAPGITFICASCYPLRWTEGDPEVQGRWNDYFELKPYTEDRLSQLLSYIELLLPFSRDSSLALHEIRTGKNAPAVVDGPARLIQKWTGGILRDIMMLIVDASTRAIQADEPNLSVSRLEITWQSIQTRQITDFLQILPHP